MAAKSRRINQKWLEGQPNVPVIMRGMIFLAKGEEEELSLKNLLDNARLNDERGVRIISLQEVAKLEPSICLQGVTAALYSENEAIVDPWLLAMTHVYGMEKAGVISHTNCKVLKVKYRSLMSIRT